MNAFAHILRRLLHLDRPVPDQTPESFAAEVERHYRWNFVVNLLDGATFALGATFFTAATIIPLFINKLTPNPYVLGAVAIIAQAGWFLPQLLTANVVEALPWKKPVVVNLGFFLERLPMLVMVMGAALAGISPVFALVVFLAGYAWHTLGAGLVATAWQELIARCFPVNRRGRFLGGTWFIGCGTGAVGGLFCSWLLAKLPFPANFVAVFTCAAVFIFMSWVFLALAREPAPPVKPTQASHTQYLAQLPGIIRSDDNYRRFLVARVILALGGMGTGFVMVAAARRFDLPESSGGLFTASFFVGQMIGNLVFGFLADTRGHKLSLEAAALAAAASFAAVLLAPSPGWFHGAFLLAGLHVGAINVSGMLVVLEFAPKDKIPTYTGLTNTAIGLLSLVSPLLGAFLFSRSDRALFGITVAVNIAALVLMRFWVREPRFATRSEGAFSVIVPVRE